MDQKRQNISKCLKFNTRSMSNTCLKKVLTQKNAKGLQINEM